MSFDQLIERIVPEDRHILRRTVQRMEQNLPPMPEEFCIARPDGTIRTLHSEIEAIRDSSGKIIKLIGVDRDVTELREAEHERDELGRQLQHAQKLEATGTLAGGIARDRLEPVPPIFADEGQIHQVVTNLVTNAAQAIGNGMGSITVEVAPATRDDDSRAVLLSVIDTGCGMDAATQSRIFDPFFTTKAPGDGTGLGLSVVHGIVTAHHAAISVESAPGQGTRFDILFPASPEVPPHRQ